MTAAPPDPVATTLAKFADESLWEIRRDVPVFCEHILHDKDGNEIYRVDLERLQRIADGINRREREDGVIPLITDGHTKPGKPQSEQPDLLGYTRNAKLIQYGSERKWALTVDRYVRREKAAKAKDRPHQSLEFFPKTDEVFAVALLITPPELNLPMQIYDAGEGRGPCYRYSMETMKHDAEGDLNENERATAGRYMKHYEKTHPLMKHLCGKYGKDCGMVGYEAAMPGDTNAFVPGATTRKESTHMEKSAEMVQYEKTVADLTRQNQEMAAQLSALQKENRLVRYEKELGELVQLEAISADAVAPMLKECEDVSPEEFARRKVFIVNTAKRLREDYQRRIMAGEMIQLTRQPVEGINGPQPTTQARRDAAVKLATDKGIGYNEALSLIPA